MGQKENEDLLRTGGNDAVSEATAALDAGADLEATDGEVRMQQHRRLLQHRR
jgi:hypothetical protein